jgi:hypothetical protein
VGPYDLRFKGCFLLLIIMILYYFSHALAAHVTTMAYTLVRPDGICPKGRGVHVRHIEVQV